MKKRMIWKGIVAGSAALMMTVGAFAAEAVTEEPAEEYTVEYEYDENGWVISEKYFAPDGTRYTLPNGTSGYVNAGMISSSLPADQVWVDADDNPVVNADLGYAHVTRGQDADGHVVLVQFFDADDSLVVTPAGYAIVARAYGENGKQAAEGYFDADEQPIEVKGVAGWLKYYDEAGNVTEQISFDAEGSVIE